jgi:AraC-like DNA-binding protein
MPTAAAQHDAPVRRSTVSIRVVRGLVAALELHGVPRSVFLESAQLCEEQLASAEARFTRAEVYRLCELAIDMTADPALGLHWAEKQPGCTFNPLSDLITHAPTLRHGLDALCHFHPLLSDDASFQLSESADKATFRCSHLSGAPPRVQRFASEMFVLGHFQLLRSFDVDARVERASFEYAAPSYHAEYTRVFEGAELFEQPITGIVFDRALLDAPSPYKDEDMYDALRAIAERHMLHTQRASFALRVRELLVRQRSTGRGEMRTVARALGLSVRSLRRRLVAEGVSYTSVANDALAMVAKHYLVDEQYSIQQTAYEMGFSDPRAFHRAFKSWTGMTPDAFRNSRSGRASTNTRPNRATAAASMSIENRT